MIELHYWPTPNGWKITIALEEMGLPYEVRPVNIGRGEQFAPGFLAISPNNRMPAIVDRAPADGGPPISVFESGAILEYLADKTGKLLPREPRGRAEVLQWVYWQVAGLGPMSGQLGHFKVYAAEKIPYAIERYQGEVERLWAVLDRRLEGREFVAGDAVTIADCAIWPWVVGYARIGVEAEKFPHVLRWKEAYEAGCAPPVVLAATHERALDYVPLEALKRHAVDAVPDEESP